MKTCAKSISTAYNANINSEMSHCFYWQVCHLVQGNTCAGEFIGGSAPGHQPLAPVYRLPVVYSLRGVQQVIQDLVQVLRIGSIRAVSVDVSCSGPFALSKQHLRLKRRIWGHFQLNTITPQQTTPLSCHNHNRTKHNRYVTYLLSEINTTTTINHHRRQIHATCLPPRPDASTASPPKTQKLTRIIRFFSQYQIWTSRP